MNNLINTSRPRSRLLKGLFTTALYRLLTHLFSGLIITYFSVSIKIMDTNLNLLLNLLPEIKVVEGIIIDL